MIDDRPDPPPIRQPGPGRPYREPVRPLTEKDLPPKKPKRTHYVAKGVTSLGAAVTLAYALAISTDLGWLHGSSATSWLTGFMCGVGIMGLIIYGASQLIMKGKL
jgi:hypothetical protein